MAKAKKSTPAKPAPKPAKAPAKPAPKAEAPKPAAAKAPAAKPAPVKAAAAKPGAAKPVVKVAPKAAVKPVAKEPAKPALKAPAAAPGKSAPVARAAGKSGPVKKGKAEEAVKPFVGKHPFLTKGDLEDFRKALLNFRDRLVDEIGFLSGDNLARNSREASGDLSNYSLHMADQGTDNFDREFALNLVSGEHDVLYEIDEALQRIDAGTYGICEMTQQPIEKERLKVIPYARYSVKAQSELERGKTKYRPFGPTLSQL